MFTLFNSKGFRAFLLLTAFSFLTVVQTLNGQTPTPSPLATPPANAPQSAQTGKPPVIIIPGLIGSELINKETGETVWFDLSRSKTDDLRLPISLNLMANRDNLVAGDILRNIKYLKFLPETEIYQSIASSLKIPGSYEEGNWETPTDNGFQDTYYVFPYDWRRDNVENAKILTQKINALKRKLRRPNLKFNVIAHSMGGLIARYAARYGTADLPAGRPRVTWAGAKNFNRIFLLGTPNAGSVQSLDSFLNGFSYIGGGLNLPFVQNLSRYDVFTIPSIYQLLPHNGTQTVYDENLKPLNLDFFDIKNWDKYGWNPIDEKNFAKEFSPAEVRNARAYLTAVLSRAKRFQQALDVDLGKSPVPIYLIGGDCKETLDAVVVYQKKDKWKTLTKADSFETNTGTKVSSEELKKVIYAKGDGTVSMRSLIGEIGGENGKSVLPVTSELFLCSEHTKLVTSPEAQDRLFALLFNDATQIKDTKAAK